MTAPDRIWLQDGGDYDASFEVTRRQHRVGDDDTEYLRADLHTAEAARLTSERDQVVAANGLLMERLERARVIIEGFQIAHFRRDPEDCSCVNCTKARAFLAKPEGQP